MSLWESVLIAFGLCADCFAVSLCSSTTVRNPGSRSTTVVALAFAVIQAGLLLAGWGFGELFSGILGKAARIVAFVLLLYVSVSMLVEAFSGKEEVRRLDSLRNVLLGGVATSIDAAIVGASQSISGVDWKGIFPLFVSVFAITALSVVLGIRGGSHLGNRYGKAAEIVGGLVLLSIAFWNLFK